MSPKTTSIWKVNNPEAKEEIKRENRNHVIVKEGENRSQA
jgi:hypothetical protein